MLETQQLVAATRLFIRTCLERTRTADAIRTQPKLLCNKVFQEIVQDFVLLSFRSDCLWLQIQKFGFDSRRYQIFWEVVGLERGPLSLVSTTEELLGRKSSGFGPEIREYDRRDPSRWPRGTLYLQTLVLTLQTSGGRSVGIVRSRTQATELLFPSPPERIFFSQVHQSKKFCMSKCFVSVLF
jgi:hypothetical protein